MVLRLLKGRIGSGRRKVDTRSNNKQEVQATTVFPNPFTSELIINAPIGANVLVRDLSGRVIFETTNSSIGQRINTDSWKTGVYLVRIQFSDEWKTLKCIKI